MASFVAALSRLQTWYHLPDNLSSRSSCLLPLNVPKRRRRPRHSMVSNSNSTDEAYSQQDEDSSSSSDNSSSDVPEKIEYISFTESTTTSSDTFSHTPTTQQWGKGQVRELPLFPLNLVLQPGGIVPLHIFEMRYRLMFNRLRDSDGKFGIVMTAKEKGDTVAITGCEAELVRFESLPDGRIITVSTGKERFRILKFTQKEPYLKAMVQFVNDDCVEDLLNDDKGNVNGEKENVIDVELKKLENDVWEKLQDVLRLSNKLYNKGIDVKEIIKELAPPDNTTKNRVEDRKRRVKFSFAVSQILDLSMREQQLLLQTRDTGKRFQKQSKVLESARQYLAAQVTLKDALDPK